MTDLVQKIADAVIKVVRPSTATEANEIFTAICQALAQGGEAVASGGDAHLALIDDLREEIAEALGEAYDCNRDWSAWSYGTIGPDDFSLVAGDDARLQEIAEAAASVISAHPAPSADRVAELDAQLAAANNRLHEVSELCATTEQQLAESREREGRMREAVRENHQWHLDYDEYDGYLESALYETNMAALAADKEKK